MDHESRADAKLKTLPKETRDEIWELRHPVDEEAKPLTYVELLAWLEGRGISSSLAALHGFFKAERQAREIVDARDFADRAKLELMKDPEMTPEAAAQWAQFVFTSRVAADGNLQGFVALEKIRPARHGSWSWKQRRARSCMAGWTSDGTMT